MGGGGARGFAHIGVLRILERENIPIKGIAGTSMGAIVGALYAQKQNSHRVEEALKDFIQSPLFHNTNAATTQQKKTTSFLDFMAIELCEQLKDSAKMRETIQRMDQEMQHALDLLLGKGDIRDCRLPFAAVASDLRTGAEIVLRKGPLAQAVFASAAMPGVFSPVSIDGYLLSDGAATSAVPIRAARSMWPSKVLAVDVSSTLSTFPPLDNALQIVLRSSAVSGHCYHNELVKEADILLQPHVKLFSWSEFDSFEDFIAEGEQAAIKALKKIKRAVRIY